MLLYPLHSVSEAIEVGIGFSCIFELLVSLHPNHQKRVNQEILLFFIGVHRTTPIPIFHLVWSAPVWIAHTNDLDNLAKSWFCRCQFGVLDQAYFVTPCSLDEDVELYQLLAGSFFDNLSVCTLVAIAYNVTSVFIESIK